MSKKSVILKISSAILVLVAVSGAIMLFSVENRDTVVEQNGAVIASTNESSVERINAMLTTALDQLQTIAYVFGQSYFDSSVDSERVLSYYRNGPFYTLHFISRDGLVHLSDKRVVDVSDRPFFKYGINGISGAIPIKHNRITGGNVLDFYTPVYSSGEIVGVMLGICDQDKLKDIMHNELFGYATNTTMILASGDIIASSYTLDGEVNFFDLLLENPALNESDIRALRSAAEEDVPILLNRSGNIGGQISLSLIPTAFDGVFLVQSFPEEVATEMIYKFNAVGFRLEITLLVIFCLYALYLIISYSTQKKRLVEEKEKAVTLKSIYESSLSAVANSYDGIYHINVRTRECMMIYPFLGAENEAGLYDELLAFKVNNSTISAIDSDTDVFEFLALDNLVEHLRSADTFDLKYNRILRGGGFPKRCLATYTCCSRGEDGSVETIVLAIKSIEELLIKEDAQRRVLQTAVDRAEAASHAKSRFLSLMSHDIRTPLNAIMGLTTIAVMHIDDKDRVLDALDKIILSSRHLLSLINEILDMAKIESGRMTLSNEHFNLPDEIDSLLSIFKSQINAKRLTLDLNLSRVEHEEVIGDMLRLQQILINILGNAVKFTSDGGCIKFYVTESPTHKNEYYQYKFIIEDNGIGMSQDFINSAFEPFTRDENKKVQSTEGTGLGLTIANNIAHLMGGDIQAESELGKGSRFTVTVYLGVGDNTIKEDYSELLALPVLIVDDDLVTCEYEMELLSSVGMISDYVLSGKEAVERIVEHHEAGNDYSVVVLDLLMPEMDGIETAERIRGAVGPEIPIIILTTYDWSEIEEEARRAGVNGFVSKPIFKSRLLGALKNAFNRVDKLPVANYANELVQSDFSGFRILLVEDNELNAEIATELLKDAGFIVDRAVNGRCAVDILDNAEDGTYCCVLMDIQMPVMNGYEATTIIRGRDREYLKRIPIIAMSADAFKDDVDRSLSSGMNDHISKPVEVEKLIKTLRAFINPST